MRKGYADLHVHTNYSDGCHSPRDVVQFAVNAGLSWLAITDHDTVDGLGEGTEEAGRFGLGFVPGLELSVEHGGQDFHFLAYWIEPSDAGLTELLDEISLSRIERAREIVSRLHALGVPLRIESVERQTRVRRTVGRPHVARALIEEGWVSTIHDAFARFLRVGAPAYVAKRPVDPGRALGVLRRAGGVPVLAHPAAYRLNGTLRSFLRQGLQGIETEHPTHTPEQAAGFRRLADRLGIAATGGSDFHGEPLSDALVGGTRVPASVLDHLVARKE